MIPALAWAEQKTELLKKLWTAGFSSGSIVKVMADNGYSVTRNAVIGKVNRLGLIRDPGKITRKRPPRRKLKAKSKQKTIILPNYERGVLVVKHTSKGSDMKGPNEAKNVLLTETKDGDCRAIVRYRNDLLAEAVCCGEQTPWIENKGRLVRSPWCLYHREKFIDRKRTNERSGRHAPKI